MLFVHKMRKSYLYRKRLLLHNHAVEETERNANQSRYKLLKTSQKKKKKNRLYEKTLILLRNRRERETLARAIMASLIASPRGKRVSGVLARCARYNSCEK